MFILLLMRDKKNALPVDKRAAIIVAWHKSVLCLACERKKTRRKQFENGSVVTVSS